MIIIINFKNYKSGEGVIKLAKKIEKYNKNMIIALPSLYIEEVLHKTKLNVFAQHLAYIHSKKETGFITPESLKKSGAKGSLLNHSEHKIPFSQIKQTIKNSKGLRLIICVSSIKEAKLIKKYKPWAMAYEDPELIATGKSITKYDSKSVKEFVKILKGTKIIPLCGAGISTIEDVTEAKKIGCKGVLIASAIANSKNPDKFLKELK